VYSVKPRDISEAFLAWSNDLISQTINVRGAIDLQKGGVYRNKAAENELIEGDRDRAVR
jgi:hypothetical protein